MKELFERHQSRLTDTENRRVWETMYDATQVKSRRRWWVPTTVTAGALAVIAVAMIGPDIMQRGSVETMTEAENPEAARVDELIADGDLNRTDLNATDRPRDMSSADLNAAGDSDAPPAVGSAKNVTKTKAKEARSTPPEETQARAAKPERTDRAQKDSREENKAAPVMAVAGDPVVAAELSAPSTAPAEGVIRGRATAPDGSPLVFANVLLAGTNVFTTTDHEGRFELTGVPAGIDTLSVLYMGYETVDWGFDMKGETLMAELTLEPATPAVINFGDEVDTFAEAVALKKDAPAHGGEFYFRGGRAGETQYQIDGIPVNEPVAGAKPQGESGSAPSEIASNRSDDKNETREGVLSRGRVESELSQIRVTEDSGADQDGSALGSAASKSKIEADARRQNVQEKSREEVKRYSPAVPPVAAPPDATHPISVGGTDPVNGAAYDAMFFEHYGVNPFIDPQDDRFATFAVDVDNASFSLARSYLSDGNLPPKEAIRVEEFVNAFNHRYPAPGTPLTASRRPIPSEHGTFAIYLDATPSPFGPNKHLLRVGLKGREISAENRKPATLTFLVDVSGSMGREDRLGLVKQALGLLLDQMRGDDRVGLVVYGSNARVLLPHTPLGDRWRIEQAIQSLQPEGATNAEAGLLEAYRLADRSFDGNRINRVVLCSDGVANVGNTGADAILARIKSEARRGIELTAVGFGMGNYNDVLMEKLANQGDGNYFYVDQLDEARKVFVENLTGTLQTIAKDMKIQVEFDPKMVRSYRLLGYENRDVADRDFRNDAVDAGEVGAGHEVTALFELNLQAGRKRGDLATVRIRYADPEKGRVFEEARSLNRRDVRSSWNDADPTFRMDAAIAECAEILRHSYWAKESDLGRVVGLAHAAAWEMGRPDDAMAVVDLIERAARAWPVDTPTGWRGDPLPGGDDR